MRTFLMIVFLLVCLALTAMVILQEGKDQRLGSIAGMGDTFWGQNRSKSFEGRIVQFTAFAAGAFLVLALLLNAIPADGGNHAHVTVSPETETEAFTVTETEAETSGLFETESAEGTYSGLPETETEADASAR